MSLAPELHDGTVVFVSVPAATDLTGLDVVASMREGEGLTLVLPEAQAKKRSFAVLWQARWITLTVNTELKAVGITAAFATALADNDIACNVIAGAYHDHLFVPVELADRAMAVLRDMPSSKTG